MVCAAMAQILEKDVSREVEAVGFRLRNSEALKSDGQLAHVSLEWQPEFKTLISEFSSFFQDVPEHTTLAVHDVDVGGSPPIKQHPYRLAPSKLQSLREELTYILHIGAVEHGQSEWSSPVVLVRKLDETLRPCIDCKSGD